MGTRFAALPIMRVASLAIAATVATVGCNSHSVDGTIDYQVEGGVGGNGDGTAMSIAPDGTATRAWKGGARETFMLDADTLDEIHDKLLNVSFETLEPSYETCCDQFVTRLSVRIDGAPYTVRVTEGAGDVPPALMEAIDALEAVADPAS